MVKENESPKKELVKAVTLEDVLKEIQALRAEIKALKMNFLQVSQLKMTGGSRV